MGDLKVGDRVRIISTSSGFNWGGIKKNSLATVTREADEDGIVRVKTDCGEYEKWGSHESCFEKICFYPFNLERALKGDPVITRQGKKVYWVKEREGFHGTWILEADVEGELITEPYFKEDGTFHPSGKESCYDLFMAELPTTKPEVKKQPVRKPAVKKADGTKIKQTVIKEEQKMAQAPKSKTAVLVAQNKEALITAAKIEAGSIATKRIIDLIKPKLPIMARGYADTAVARVVVANLFSLAVQQYASENKKAEVIADAMMQGAMVEFVKSFNIEQIIEQVTKGVDFTKITGADSEE